MRFMHRTLCIMNIAHLFSRHCTGKARTWKCSKIPSRAMLAVGVKTNPVLLTALGELRGGIAN